MGKRVGREGWVIGASSGARPRPYSQPFAAAAAPNRVWCADCRGWFRSQDGERIDPLPITDVHSRCLLRCQAVEKANTERVQAIFEALFREHGMPQAIRSDNRAPFASRAIAGRSRQVVGWMKLASCRSAWRPGIRSRTDGTSACIAG